MTVERFKNETGFAEVCIPSPEREIAGAYIGDLLSWVMGKAESSNVWITIMSNVNVIAVATLTDVSCVVLAEGVMPDDGVTETAMAKGVNILSTDLSAFEAAKMIAALVS